MNEELVGKAIAGRREQVVLATKFGNVRDANGKFAGVRGDRAYVRQCCEESLKRLSVETIDLYYQHRVARDLDAIEQIFPVGVTVGDRYHAQGMRSVDRS